MMTISPTYLFLWKKKNFCGALWALLEYYREKKIPTAYYFNIRAHIGIWVQISSNTLLYLPSLKSFFVVILWTQKVALTKWGAAFNESVVPPSPRFPQCKWLMHYIAYLHKTSIINVPHFLEKELGKIWGSDV